MALPADKHPPAPARPIYEIREPSWCPRCSDTRGPFDYDAETDTWVCTRCAATWCASVPERRR